MPKISTDSVPATDFPSPRGGGSLQQFVGFCIYSKDGRKRIFKKLIWVVAQQSSNTFPTLSSKWLNLCEFKTRDEVKHGRQVNKYCISRHQRCSLLPISKNKVKNLPYILRKAKITLPILMAKIGMLSLTLEIIEIKNKLQLGDYDCLRN